MKHLNHRLIAGLGASATAVVTALALSTPAHALATSFTPDGGPGANFEGTSISFTAQPSGQTLTCTTFDLSGTITSPGASRAYGDEAGSLGTLTSSGCTNPIAGATTVTPIGTWKVTITGDETAPGVWPARIYDVRADVVAAGCQFEAGDAANANGGFVDGSFDEATQVFTPSSTSAGLEIATDPVGTICPLLNVYKEDPIDVGGTWQNTDANPLTIANP